MRLNNYIYLSLLEMDFLTPRSSPRFVKPCLEMSMENPTSESQTSILQSLKMSTFVPFNNQQWEQKSVWPIVGGGAKNRIFIYVSQEFRKWKLFWYWLLLVQLWRKTIIILHLTFWIYRNKSTKRTGHRTIIQCNVVVEKSFCKKFQVSCHAKYFSHQIFWYLQ